MFNAHAEPLDFVVPVDHGRQWQVVVDTARPGGRAAGQRARRSPAGDRLTLVDRSLTVLQRPGVRAASDGRCPGVGRAAATGVPATGPVGPAGVRRLRRCA